MTAQGEFGGGYPPSMDLEPAGVGVRFVARLLDGVIVAIVAVVLAVMFNAERNNIYVAAVFFSLLTFAYFVAFESTRGWTPGKKLLGLSVRGAGGAPKPTARQSAIRNAFTLVNVLPYVGGLLGLTAYLLIASTISTSPTKQGKHDQWAGSTQVLRTVSRRPDVT